MAGLLLLNRKRDRHPYIRHNRCSKAFRRVVFSVVGSTHGLRAADGRIVPREAPPADLDPQGLLFIHTSPTRQF